MGSVAVEQFRILLSKELVNLQSKLRLKVEIMFHEGTITRPEADEMFTMIGEAMHS